MELDATQAEVAAVEADGIINPQYLDRLLPFLAEAVCIYDMHGAMKARIAPPGGLLGHGSVAGASVYDNIHPDDMPAGIQIGTAMHSSEPGWRGTFGARLRHADGTYRRYQIRVFNMVHDPEIEGVVLCIREAIGDDGRPEILGLHHDPLLRSMAEAIPTASLMLDGHGRIRHASGLATEVLGRSESDLFGLDLVALATGDGRLALTAAVASAIDHPGEHSVMFGYQRGQELLLLEARIHARDTAGRTSLITVVLTDHSQEPELVRLATRDPLTGLANRTVFADTVAGLLTAERPQLSVLFCDVDQFKLLNDAHGHHSGDEALMSVAQQLTAMVREVDLVARFGGDEFVIACPDLTAREAQALALRLRDEVRIPGPNGSTDLRISVGAATARAGDTADALLGRADQRMFSAKRASRSG